MFTDFASSNWKYACAVESQIGFNLKWQCEEEQVIHLLLLLHELLLLRGEGQGEDVDGGRCVPDPVNHFLISRLRQRLPD